MKTKNFVCAFMVAAVAQISANAQQTSTSSHSVVADYYQSAYKLSGTPLLSALHNIIKNHTVVTYSSLWTHFQTTDKKSNGKVWDIYSDIPGGIPPYEYTFSTNQCGNYNSEADCYNREHSWPASWFGNNSSSPPYSDLFHLYPTDGYVNNRRGNYPFGTVSNSTWTSMNGSTLGNNTSAGYSGVVFEPIDAYKGDLARSALYMSVRYYTEDASWATSAATNKSTILPWYLMLLLSWHENDSVSLKEIQRNEAIYGIQHNRNPFIDHPEFATEIWNTNAAPTVVSAHEITATTIILDFSRYLDSTEAVSVTNFVFDHSIGNPLNIQWGVDNDISKLLLKTIALQPARTYTIQIKNLKSINGVTMNDTIVSFITSGTADVKSNTPIPAVFSLSQNYPNPFNPNTEIHFSLSTPDHVSLKIYNILGIVVSELLNERVEAGKHKVRFDASNLPSGIYFYTLHSNFYSVTKRMMLLR